jgi:hypothetical protein
MNFIITLTEHRVLGFVLAPYLDKEGAGEEYYEVYDRVTNQSLESYKHLLSPEQIQIVKYIEQYNSQNLFKLFSKKKKQTPRDFIENLSFDLLQEHIRPHIEKYIARSLEVMEFNPVAIYHKILQNKIYENDRIELINKNCETIFNFTRNQEGIQYKLTIQRENDELNLLGKEAIVLSNDPCCLAIENKLYVFKDIDAKKYFLS